MLSTSKQTGKHPVQRNWYFQDKLCLSKATFRWFPNFSTCTYNKHRFFLVLDSTDSAMKISTCNFRPKFNDFQKSGLLFSEKKTFRSSNS